MKVARNEKRKKLHGFSYYKNIANFEAFCRYKNFSKNLLYLGSACLWSVVTQKMQNVADIDKFCFYVFFQPIWNLFSIGLLYLSVIWIGLYTKYLTERAQRKAFLETRRSLEMRFKTQKENERQERLLLSVLPSFVAQQVCNLLADVLFIYCNLFLWVCTQWYILKYRILLPIWVHF